MFADRVKESSTTTGTGTINLGGAATGGYQTFVAGIGTGKQCYYAIQNTSANEWEVGIGTVTSGSPDTLSRTTVLASSNAGALVSFTSGTKEVFCTLPANVPISIETANPSSPKVGYMWVLQNSIPVGGVMGMLGMSYAAQTFLNDYTIKINTNNGIKTIQLT